MDYEKQAIEILQTFASDEKYLIADSGGKDSSVLRHITERANVPFEIVHNLTTVDAPETVYYVRKMQMEYLKRGIAYTIAKPKESMAQLIIKRRTPPTRLIRYCCQELKETYGMGRKVVTGVRKAESNNRKNNQGAVTFPKPKKDIRNMVDEKNFILTNKGGVVCAAPVIAWIAVSAAIGPSWR